MAQRNIKSNRVSLELTRLRSLPSKVASIETSGSTIKRLEEQIQNLINEQKSLNRRAASLHRRNLQLAELNQAKDEFIAIASHQLRTPATGVKQYIRLLLDGYGDPLTENQKFFLERAHESNDRQLKIIDDLLQVARIDSNTFKLSTKKTDIKKMATETINDFKKKAENRHQRIFFAAPKEKVESKVDAGRLRMVLENLIDNAINYSLDSKIIRVKLLNGRQYIKMIVEDHGVGIERHDYPKLFQKFSRIPNPLSVEVGGTGLGLYWAQKIVRLHGGDIDVTSKIGSGSTFTVILPRLK